MVSGRRLSLPREGAHHRLFAALRSRQEEDRAQACCCEACSCEAYYSKACSCEAYYSKAYYSKACSCEACSCKGGGGRVKPVRCTAGQLLFIETTAAQARRAAYKAAAFATYFPTLFCCTIVIRCDVKHEIACHAAAEKAADDGPSRA